MRCLQLVVLQHVQVVLVLTAKLRVKELARLPADCRYWYWSGDSITVDTGLFADKFFYLHLLRADYFVSASIHVHPATIGSVMPLSPGNGLSVNLRIVRD